MDGAQLRRGTSLYHSRTEEVLWVTTVKRDTVRLTSLTDTFEMKREHLVRQVGEGDIVIETQPPVPQDGRTK